MSLTATPSPAERLRNVPPDVSRTAFRSTFRSVGAALLAGSAVLAALLATSEMLPLTWDEGESIDRARKILDGTNFRDWPFTVSREGHPAGYGLLIAVGNRIAPPLPSKTSWRFGPILLAAIASGAVFYRMEKRYGIPAATFALAAIWLLPRMFAHGHIAACDGPLCAAWLLAWTALDPARRSVCGALLFGALLGLTASMKFTGWLALPPLLTALCLHPRFRKTDDTNAGPDLPEKGTRTALFLRAGFALIVALTVFVLLNPPLWHDPLSGLGTHFRLNTHRIEQFNITGYFLGRLYNLDYPLPWYNTLFLTAITVPAGFLFLFAVGLRTCFQRRSGASLLLCMATMLVIRALPFAPPHDGIRLFLPAFPFLAMIAGLGAATLWTGRRKNIDNADKSAENPEGPKNHATKTGDAEIPNGKRLPFARALVSVVYLVGIANLFLYVPQWLSYYNILIGGLPGAVRAGMEPTYWWDALDRETLQWINANTPEGEAVRFSAFSSKTLRLYREWGDLRPPVSYGKIPYRYYVLQRRPGAETAFDRELIERARPVYVKRLFGVPLLEIYDLGP